MARILGSTGEARIQWLNQKRLISSLDVRMAVNDAKEKIRGRSRHSDCLTDIHDAIMSPKETQARCPEASLCRVIFKA